MMWSNEPYVEEKPGMFGTWRGAFLFIGIFLCVETLFAFIVVAFLTSGGIE